ncbi:MAG: hydroxyacid dehydrogenase [Paracoccaceae bacterium]|nr:hydroxyacid dehydrogenase [Paracoccaceae bacterium]
MYKILVIEPLHQEALQLIESRNDVSYQLITDVSEENILAHIEDADALTIRVSTLSKKALQKGRKLKVVSRHGVGYDNIPLDECNRLGIPLALVGSVNSIAVSEQTIFLMMAAAKLGAIFNQGVKAGNFGIRSKYRPMELNGKKLLIVGFGKIGREVAKRAQAFGMDILVYDPYLKPDDGDLKVLPSLEEGLEIADVITLHLPLTSETKYLIGKKELAILKDKAILVNTSRGGIIDENALHQTLCEGKLHGVGLDVFEEEPVHPGNPILSHDRVIVSPHTSALTDDTLKAMGMMTVKNALNAIDGCLDPTLVLNPEVLST